MNVKPRSKNISARSRRLSLERSRHMITSKFSRSQNPLKKDLCLFIPSLCPIEPCKRREGGYPNCPPYPCSKTRIDPDAWLATLDQKMYLRHVGQDGCVDVDLATYYMVLRWLGVRSCYRCQRRTASLLFGIRIRSLSYFPSRVWSGQRWPGTRM